MSRVMGWLVLLAALFVGAGQELGATQGGGPVDAPCPDQRATQEDGHVLDGPRYMLCMGVYYAYGITIQVNDRICPLMRTRYPARGVCRGEASEGTRCVAAGELDVTRERCRCAFLQLFGLTLPVLTCGCESYGVVGHVTDAETVACR